MPRKISGMWDVQGAHQEKINHDCKMLDNESRLINLLPGGIKKLCQHKILVKKFSEVYCKSNNIKIEGGIKQGLPYIRFYSSFF